MSRNNGVILPDLEEKDTSMAKTDKTCRSTIANPGPAYVFPFFHSPLTAYQPVSSSGIFSFAATTFLLSMFNVGTRGIQTPNVIVGMAIFSGGLLQFIAGMWAFSRGNIFEATDKLFLNKEQISTTSSSCLSVTVFLPSAFSLFCLWYLLDVLCCHLHPVVYCIWLSVP